MSMSRVAARSAPTQSTARASGSTTRTEGTVRSLRERGDIRMKEIMERIAFVALACLIIMVMLVMPDAW
jgi:hypothetical protein